MIRDTSENICEIFQILRVDCLCPGLKIVSWNDAKMIRRRANISRPVPATFCKVRLPFFEFFTENLRRLALELIARPRLLCYHKTAASGCFPTSILNAINRNAQKGIYFAMNTYKLLTPGPLTTTDTVKREMLADCCTWDSDYKAVTQKIRCQLLELAHVSPAEYTAVLMQGSGTFGVESVFTSVIGEGEKVLICSNGAYGERMTAICDHAKIAYTHYAEPYDRIPDAARVAGLLAADPAITHVAIVHSETTSGILNDIEAVGKAVKAAGRTYIVDAMSSFGGVEIPVAEWGIDFLISSANKCIQGVPGFSFIICRRGRLAESAGKARSLSLDLYEQWKEMEKDGKWRYTSPTHVVLAFSKALDELAEEGGIPARNRRYTENNRLLIEKMAGLGFDTYIGPEHQGPFITTFFYPRGISFAFGEFYAYIKERGYAIFPGKLTEADTFRVGSNGEIYPEDIEKLTGIIVGFLEMKKEARA